MYCCLENISSLNNIDIMSVITFNHTIPKEVMFINISTGLIRKVFKNWEAGKLMRIDMFPKILIFAWKLKIFH